MIPWDSRRPRSSRSKKAAKLWKSFAQQLPCRYWKVTLARPARPDLKPSFSRKLAVSVRFYVFCSVSITQKPQTQKTAWCFYFKGQQKRRALVAFHLYVILSNLPFTPKAVFLKSCKTFCFVIVSWCAFIIRSVCTWSPSWDRVQWTGIGHNGSR